jgi:hypothetical protein
MTMKSKGVLLMKTCGSGIAKRRGVALIATLFTVAVVLILGLSFLVLSISENRNSRLEKESAMALQLARSGAELMMNYMSCNRANFGDKQSKPIWVLEDQFTGLPCKLAEYPNPSDPLIFRETNDLAEELKFNVTRAWDEQKSAYFYDVTITPDRKLDPDGNYLGRIQLRVIQARFAQGQPQQFVLNSVGRIYRHGDSLPVAARQVEYRVREKAAMDNLMFMQNHRAYDMVGNGVPPPNASDGTNNASGIPAGYVARGSVVIDGGSDFAYETAGNYQFFSTDGVQFLGSVSINQADNLYPEGTSQEKIDSLFRGGILTGQPTVGLPHKEGYMNSDLDGNGSLTLSEQGRSAMMAMDSSGTNPKGEGYVKAFWKHGDNSGFTTPPGKIGHSRAPSPETWSGEYGADPEDPHDNMAVDVPADVEFDGTLANKNPGFATFLLELYDQDGTGMFTLKKITRYTNKEIILMKDVKISLLKNGILYFEGGNVDVKGTCNGQLTVVSAESPYREAFAYDVKLEGVAEPIRQYASIEQNMNVYPGSSNYWVPGKINNARIEWVRQAFSKTNDYDPSLPNSDYIYLPYDDPRLPLRVDPATGNVSGEFPREGPYKIGGRWVWPGNDMIRHSVTNLTADDGGKTGLFQNPEKEGNAILGGNLDYSVGGGNVLGIIAKNFILINDDSATAVNPIINIRAVLMSFDHSLQFDDVNLAGKSTWISTPGMRGRFNFIGSIISQYADVEGKIDGTGYTVQNFAWDTNLTNNLPPNFPHWDITMHDPQTIMDFVILSYQDKGSLKVQ